MRMLSFCLLFLLTVQNLAAGEPEGPKSYSAQDFYDTISMHGASFSFDDSALFVSSNLKSPSEIVAEEQFKTFSPDSNEIYYTTDQQGEFREAWKYDLLKRSHQLVSGGQWNVADLKFSRNGRYRLIYKNEDSQYQTYIRDMIRGKDLQLPKLPGQMLSLTFSPSEKFLGFYVNGDARPSDLYTLNLETLKLDRLTHNLSSKIDENDLVDGQLIQYPSFDGLEIPAILYHPKRASSNFPVGGMIWVHGGPGSQSMKLYSPLIQYLVNHNIAVLSVNNRGSFGYGKTFYHASDRKHGDVDLKDCIWGKKYLESLDWIQKDNIGIMGASYGGYLTVAAMTFAPEEFKIGVDIFGVTNWVRTLEQIPAWWKSHREALYTLIGDPVKDRAMLIAKSPLFHATKIRNPLLVIQGANDPRVLKIESDEIVSELKKHNVPVEYLLFQDEGHGFTKKANEIAASEASLNFILKYLK